ncbi:hypothetical protein [Dyella sp.]|jgi:hypothetical protein|uniref:hypothetical protein n=1 Tax=Dyella sp. TaxID=1869338 RepID=UPI002D7688E3|nr:hypothetical protein [Dyella sp.]HET7331961.1 hypothetical protein [Dyella sp.]
MPPGPSRQQIRWALFGFCASAMGLALLSIIQLSNPANFSEFIWARLLALLLAMLIIVLLAGGFTVALLRYRLYDADVTIGRSVAYGVLWPPLVWAAYMLTKPEHAAAFDDYAAFVIGLLPGTILLWRLSPSVWSVKTAIALLYC